MTVLIGSAPLRELASGKVARAEVYDGISASHLSDWETKWRPIILSTQARLTAQEMPRAAHPQSSHWDWNKKAAALRMLLAYRTFAVTCGGNTQGLMVVETTQHRSRLPDYKGRVGRGLVYVEFLEAAPWNRPEHVQSPKYRGVGRLLLTTAIQLSLDEEFRGRIGLHSLPQSEPYYRDIVNMRDLGPDENYQGQLRYFEFDEAGAQAFIQGGS
jgi:hypothetical protein